MIRINFKFRCSIKQKFNYNWRNLWYIFIIQYKQKLFDADNPKSTNNKILHLLETELINEK